MEERERFAGSPLTPLSERPSHADHIPRRGASPGNPPAVPSQAPADKVSGLIHAATLLAQLLGQGRALDSRALRSAMEAAFGGTDAEGTWVWKDAYEALEAAQVLFLRKFGAAMRARAGSAAAMLAMLTRLTERLPSQTRRSEESQHLQQFSTPVALGFVAAEAAAVTASDLVLEPSAGTGLLAIFAELARARLALNEIAETRAGLLGRLFRDCASVTRHNAEQIHDRLDAAIRPSVVLMNPPFSASPHVEGSFAEAAMRHVASALARLAEGGRLVAVTGRNVGPDQPAWRESFVRLQEKGRVVFTATLDGAGLCPPRHDDRDAAHRHRSRPGRGSARISGVAGNGCERFRPSRARRPPRAAARAGHRGLSHHRRPPRVPHSDLPPAETLQPTAEPGQTARPCPGLCRTRLRDPRVDAGRSRTHHREPLRGLRAAGDPHRRRHAASDETRPVGRHGRGRASPPLLPAAFAAPDPLRRHPLRRAARERHLCRRSAWRPSRRLLHRR